MRSIIADLAKNKAEYALLMAYAAALGDEMYMEEFHAQAAVVLAEYRALPD
jgi:hypothetical protein